MENYDFLFKCVAVGDGGCGKTAVVVRFSRGFFQENYKLTIGVEFAVKNIQVQNQEVKLQIWDTGGQERFQYVRPLYYKGAMGCIVLFDLTNRESFDHIPKWINEVKKEAGNIPILLVGNKSDLVHDRIIKRQEAEELAKDLKLYYVESSAKSGHGIQDIFTVLALLMMDEEIPSDIFEGNKDIKPLKKNFSKGRPKPLSVSKPEANKPIPSANNIPHPENPDFNPFLQSSNEIKDQVSDRINRVSNVLDMLVKGSSKKTAESNIKPSEWKGGIIQPKTQDPHHIKSTPTPSPKESWGFMSQKLSNSPEVKNPTIPQESRTENIVEKTDISSNSKEIICPNCKSRINRNFKFCNKCGKRI